jgi:hypothetical protein
MLVELKYLPGCIREESHKYVADNYFVSQKITAR